MQIIAPYYPIVFFRGFAFSRKELEETYNDTYNGFNSSSVERIEYTRYPPKNAKHFFEGMIIRFMKLDGYSYFDQNNNGLEKMDEPYRSLWVSRFYDYDIELDYRQTIQYHARRLNTLITKTIPERLRALGVTHGVGDSQIKVNLIAHSMGGLVCRTMMQTLMKQPQDYIHKFVTLGTPHKGFELRAFTGVLKKFKSISKFHHDNIVKNLKLSSEIHTANNQKYEAHSLGIIGGEYLQNVILKL